MLLGLPLPPVRFCGNALPIDWGIGGAVGIVCCGGGGTLPPEYWDAKFVILVFVLPGGFVTLYQQS